MNDEDCVICAKLVHQREKYDKCGVCRGKLKAIKKILNMCGSCRKCPFMYTAYGHEECKINDYDFLLRTGKKRWFDD